ncbi:MAG TPA: DUF167 family protein [Geobacteraceae bacterium]
MPLGQAVRQTADGVCIRLHVQPRASRNEICGLHGDELKLRVTSPPVEDAANRLCSEFLARLLGIAKSKVSVVAGRTSRHKTVMIQGVTLAAVMERLGSLGLASGQVDQSPT